MSWKQTTQNSFADSLVVEHKSLSGLDDVHNIINWTEIEQTLSNLYSSVRGAPSYPPLMMFKILILQAWYNLSKTRAQLIAMSHNLKTGMNIFKEMQRLKSLRGYYIQ
ncbi:hypothetical protein [uncultured Gammaproteobacteria bacterium]|jgi:transposase|nr:hypothetical protein [uncultured Gammaproteobacteria bacterium]